MGEAMSDNRIRLWFSLFVLAVFCVGLAGGVLIGRRIAINREAAAGRGFRMPPPGADFRGPMGDARDRLAGGPFAGRLIERLARDLDLTTDQRTKIEGVLTARRPRLDALQQEVRSKFDAEQESLRNEIRAILTPEQQQKFDEREKELRGRFGRRGPPPPR
jgi:Spy/CpxP family protein refolding chaperone